MKKKVSNQSVSAASKGEKPLLAFLFIQKLEKRFHCCWINVLKAPFFIGEKNKF
ncbi:MAG: hypothetical protein E7F16_09580 [Enterococcus casseliflavus]|nr:hypothetical protein [Enterococcus casseliflavus]